MIKLIKYSLVLSFVLLSKIIFCQTFQNIRGTVIDEDSRVPLWGTTIQVVDSNPLIVCITDTEGQFQLHDIPVGRATLLITSIGYENRLIQEIVVNSSKEVVLEIALREDISKITTVKIEAKKDKTESINEMSIISAKKFSVEETNQYAGTFGDPARMASNFAGVTSDAEGDNDIVVRGNSPKGILWRIEGVEIPSPNHFSEEGSTGGPISALNGKMLGNSDFLSGAFSPEYGNALSGVFDLHLRNGNNKNKEYSFGLGVLGMDFTAEGPISEESGSSYLFNYRYSSLAALEAANIIDFGGIPKYQDLAFKVRVPTKKAGTFSLFGLGGESHILEEITENEEGIYEYSLDDFSSYFGVIGLKNNLFINDRSYLVTSLSFSGNGSGYQYTSGANPEEIVLEDNERLDKMAIRSSIQYNNKINSRNKLSLGMIHSSLNYQFLLEQINDEGALTALIDNQEKTTYSQGYFTLKHRYNKNLTFVGGLHSMYFALNKTYSVEPRLALNWNVKDRNVISVGYGLHSRLENLLNYTALIPDTTGNYSQANKNLEIPKAHHFVVGHDLRISEFLHLKSELYYQHLFDVPVGSISSNSFSMINSSDWFTSIPMTSNGKGRNFGAELTLERFYHNSMYYLVTASLYKSQFQTLDNVWRDSKFDANYAFNVLIGKEFQIGESSKNKTVSISGKTSLIGGNRYTPILLENSIAEGKGVYDNDNPYTAKGDNIFSLNVAMNYKVNKQKLTHEFKVELLNATNSQARVRGYYSPETESIEYTTQLGLIPNIMYTIHF